MTSVEKLVTDHIDLWTAAIKRRSTAGRGSSNKIELYGTKKLRELILELAVRGLLVPQDPNDEPASELLKKIAAEKAKLVKEGKIKKENSLPPIAENEKPFELPKGWKWTKLIDISANVHYGYTAPSSESIKSVRLLRITDIQDDAVEWDSVPGCEIEADKIAQYELVDDDILIARTGGTIGKSYLVKNINVCAVFASYLIRVRHLNGMDAGYKKIYLGSQLYWRQLYAKSMGTGQPNVNGESLKGLVVPIPPLVEQHRIVAKVDELMVLCDQLEQQTDASLSAHQTLVETLLNALTNAADHAQFASAWQRIAEHFDTLFATEESIDQLKQTILQLAVMGKLVPQDPKDEPASELLKKIASEKARLIKEKIIKNSRPLAAISDDEKFMSLPTGWAFARLNDLGDWGAGATPSRNNSELYGGNIPWFKSGELIADYISQSEETVTELALEKASLRYNKVGDVLIAMYGATIGKTAILSIPATTNQAVCACTPFSGFENTYLLTLLKAYKPRFIGMGAGGAQPNISREKIIATVIAVPPTAEQHRIVAKVDELMALCDQLKARRSAAQTIQLHLADAIVEQALL